MKVLEATAMARPKGMRASFIALAAGLLLLTGCASTKVDLRGTLLKAPLCRVGEPPVSTLLYWTPRWRADQKEPQRREEAAQRGLEDFLARSTCLSKVAIERLAPGQALATNDEILRMAAARGVLPDRILLVVVRELGPKLSIGLPVIVEGGTEVRIDVRVLDPKAPQTLAETQTLWQNGGAFVIKGVGTLDGDLSQALRATLMEWQGAR